MFQLSVGLTHGAIHVASAPGSVLTLPQLLRPSSS